VLPRYSEKRNQDTRIIHVNPQFTA